MYCFHVLFVKMLVMFTIYTCSCQSGATESVDDPMSSSFVDADVVNVESAKEKELKGKSYRK